MAIDPGSAVTGRMLPNRLDAGGCDSGAERAGKAGDGVGGFGQGAVADDVVGAGNG